MRIGVFGAGSIGCYVGGRLAAQGADVVLVGRPRMKDEVDRFGLTAIDGAARDGTTVSLGPGAIRYVVEPSELTDRDVVLVCVKSGQTSDAGEELARTLPRDRRILVVSLQNGVRNAEVLRERLPDHPVLGGIVGFNVMSKGHGVFRRATTGPLAIEASPDARVAPLVRALERAGFEVELATDIHGKQWSKLVMNLNNAVSALTDAPTQELLFDPGYRRILAALMSEALDVLRAARVRPARLGPLPVRAFPLVLRLPGPLLRAVARLQIAIDPEARSSMWEDLTRGRLTEVEQLNGEIVRLARASGTRAPLNERIVELVHEAERAQAGSPRLAARDLWSRLHDKHIS